MPPMTLPASPARRRLTLALAAAAVAAGAGTLPARAAELLRHYRLLRASDDKSKQHIPAVFAALGSSSNPTNLLADFDPSNFDEISVARGGRMLAFASTVGE